MQQATPPAPPASRDDAPAQSPLRLGLMGPFGFGNLGDAAIQQAALENLRRQLPGATFIGVSLNPEDTQERHGLNTYPIGRMAHGGWHGSQRCSSLAASLSTLKERLARNPAPPARLLAKVLALPVELLSAAHVFRAVPRLDCFVVSGGGQLDDYWGGPWYHPYSMLLWSLFARLRGVRLCFVSVGAGPIDDWLSRIFIGAALSLAHYRSYRDGASKQLVARKGFRRDDPVYPDLAHSLPTERYLDAPGRGAGRPLVGVGPMAYFDPRVWPERDQEVYRTYLAKLADLVRWLLDQDYGALLYPGEAEHDARVIADLRRLLAERGVAADDPRVLAPPIDTVDELMAQLARTELVIASRFHGVLLPQLLNKPTLALSYHPKIDHLMADMGQAAYCLPIGSFEVAAAKERFAAMAADREAIKATMAARTRAYREALDEQYRRIFSAR